jgi:hypothetical protein
VPVDFSINLILNLKLAKNNVRAQYENNYLDARKFLDKQTAESLFPKIVRRKAKAEEEEINSATEE